MTRPTSPCPRCQRPGRIDPQQGVRTGMNLGNQCLNYGPPLMHEIRFSCPCGAQWIVRKRDAWDNGEWLERVGLRHLLSPPPPAGLDLAPRWRSRRRHDA